MRVTVVVPLVTPSLNELRHKYRDFHAYGRLRQSWQSTIFALVGRKNAAALRAHVDLRHRAKITFHSERAKLLDADNLLGGIKPCLDAIRNLGFIFDDSPQWIGTPEVTQAKSPNRQTTITIEPKEGD